MKRFLRMLVRDRSGLAVVALGWLLLILGILGELSLAMRERMGTPIHPIDQAAHDDVVLGLRASLGAESFDRAWEAGRALEEESALREFNS